MAPGSTWLDRARKENGGSFDSESVEGVKAVVRLLPFLCFTAPYMACYTQMSTVFQNQVGTHTAWESGGATPQHLRIAMCEEARCGGRMTGMRSDATITVGGCWSDMTGLSDGSPSG